MELIDIFQHSNMDYLHTSFPLEDFISGVE